MVDARTRGRSSPRISLSQQAYDRLREMIGSFTLKPEEPLVELELIEQLGMSRTPIREALHRLAQEGYIHLMPNKGWFVSGVSLKDLQEIFVMREALEGMAARLAATAMGDDRLTRIRRYLSAIDVNGLTDNSTLDPGDQIHTDIIEAANNQRLTAAVSLYQHQLGQFHYIAVRLSGRALQSYREHWAVLEALESRNEELAEHRMREHIQSTKRSLLTALAEKRVWW